MPATPFELFQSLVEHSSDAIVIVDERATIVFASQSAGRMSGYPSEERLGKSAFEMVHPDDLPRVQAAFAECLAKPGVAISCELRAKHRRGDWLDLDAVAVNRLDVPAIRGVVVNYRDITDRVRAERALRASEERLRRLVEEAHDLIYHCDSTGRFTYVNPAATRVMQYSASELLGRHFLTLIREDYRPLASEHYARQVAERTPTTYFEFPAIAKDGSEIWVGQFVQLLMADDAITGVQAIARDISGHKIAEERLRQSEARYRSLIQGAAYGIFRSARDGTLLDANPALASMLGFDSTDELMTRTMADIYADPTERPRLLAEADASPGLIGPVDVNWRKKDGTAIIVRVTARTVQGENGDPCFEGIAEDVTARRALEEQLRDAQKMEAVGRLARGVAHDFNNLLAAILGCSDLMLARLDEDHPSRADAEEIGKAAERGAALTKQLLAFSRRQTLDPREFDLHALVRGLDQILIRLAGEGVDLRIHLDGTPPRVRLEPGQVEQVLLNLVVNARDAMPRGGRLDVTVDTLALEGPTAAYPSLPAGDYARIAVRDTGIGMDAETQRHVFEPFFTTKDPAKGTGLGLSIVYAIAKDAGGAVSFSTSTGKRRHGTTFEVVLPLALTTEP